MAAHNEILTPPISDGKDHIDWTEHIIIDARGNERHV